MGWHDFFDFDSYGWSSIYQSSIWDVDVQSFIATFTVPAFGLLLSMSIISSFVLTRCFELPRHKLNTQCNHWFRGFSEHTRRNCIQGWCCLSLFASHNSQPAELMRRGSKTMITQFPLQFVHSSHWGVEDSRAVIKAFSSIDVLSTRIRFRFNWRRRLNFSRFSPWASSRWWENFIFTDDDAHHT